MVEIIMRETTNEENYKTVAERIKAFRKFCSGRSCESCEMENDFYTAEDMRTVAASLDAGVYRGDPSSMLRYAADVVERCEKEIEASSCKDCGRYNGSPCADHDDCGLYEWHNRFVKILRGDAGKEVQCEKTV